MAENEFLNGLRLDQFIKNNNDQVKNTLSSLQSANAKSISTIISNQKIQIKSLESIDKSTKSLNKSITTLLTSMNIIIKDNQTSSTKKEKKEKKPKKDSFKRKDYDKSNNDLFKSMVNKLKIISAVKTGGKLIGGALAGAGIIGFLLTGNVNMLSTGVRFLTSKFESVFKGAIDNVISPLGVKLKGIFNNIIGKITSKFEAFKGSIDDVAKRFKRVFKGAMDKVIRPVGSKIKGMFNNVIGKITGKFKAFKGSIDDVAKRFKHVFKGAMDKVIRPVGSKLKGMFNNVIGKFTKKKATKTAAKKATNTLAKKATNTVAKKKATKTLAKKATNTVAKKATNTVAKKATNTVAKKAVKSGSKAATKGILKSISNNVPLLGTLVSLPFAINRAIKGDWVGAGLEVAAGSSGALNAALPGLGTTIGYGLEASLIAKDLGVFDKKDKESDALSGSNIKVKGVSPSGIRGVPSKDIGVRSNVADSYHTHKIWKPNLSGVRNDVWNNFIGLANDYNDKTGKKVQINSAFRDTSKQQRLYDQYLRDKKAGKDPSPVAKPGRSMHNFGYALDINSIDANKMESMGLLSKWNFHRPVGKPGQKGYEPWHIEPTGLDYAKIRSGVGMSGDSAGDPSMTSSPEGDALTPIKVSSNGLRGMDENLPQGNVASKVESTVPMDVKLSSNDIEALAIALGNQMSKLPKPRNVNIMANQGNPRSNL